ncbi:hypothetical protein EUX98_g9497 [Antrodiella citrinella]|uniref:DNA 3'-5' helicase n=1 Tax=Antrodiella citrinella TaxID=2447956 RepID=A0A4S4LU14_9APHY|nr:hypothetical protein EUX98_g9497 [Antrodiella citrinella]
MPPKRRDPNAQKWTAPWMSKKTPNRPKLSEEELKTLARNMRETYGWDDNPREFQLAAVQAQLEGTDMIIQAPTGSGKTAIAAGPHLWPTSKGKITIMVSPLLALEEEMVQTFRNQFGLTAIAVNSRNGGCSYAVARKLLTEDYDILLISPEMLQSPQFVDRVLRKPQFTSKVLSMVVDEAHVASHWGAEFRKKYGTLGEVRAFLPRGTPVIAMTATLTARVRRDLHAKLQFTKGTSKFLNVGNDRPNVSIAVRAFQHPQNSYADLDFVIPEGVENPADIPKTMVYLDNIQDGSKVIDHLRSLLIKRNPTMAATEDADHLIRPFNATMSSEYREAAMDAFRNGKLRIMICTDAAGMGCDIPDIDVVVQWKLPKTLSSWIQRAGRVARGRGRSGIAVLLVERAAYSPDRAKPPGESAGATSKAAVSAIALKEWHRQLLKHDHEYAQYRSKAILGDDLIDTLASQGPLTRDGVSQLVTPTWHWWTKYGDDLIRTITGLADIRYTPIIKDAAKNTPNDVSKDVVGHDKVSLVTAAVTPSSPPPMACSTKRPRSPSSPSTEATPCASSDKYAWSRDGLGQKRIKLSNDVAPGRIPTHGGGTPLQASPSVFYQHPYNTLHAQPQTMGHTLPVFGVNLFPLLATSPITLHRP